MSRFEAWFMANYKYSWERYRTLYRNGEFVQATNPREIRKAWIAGNRVEKERIRELSNEIVRTLEFYADPEMHIIREKTDRRTYYNECSIVHADGGRRAQAVLKKIRGRK